ncbi:MAG TPA: hypothetical protein VGX21_15745, partial [Methylomirabilota bacterium]|nr:hypothetical protein [Methylomirabilota bacterium]
MNGAGLGAGAGAWGAVTAGTGWLGRGDTVPSGRKGVIGGSSRPPARVASSDCACIWRSGASSAAAISRSAPWARSAEGPMAPLAIDLIVTTR